MIALTNDMLLMLLQQRNDESEMGAATDTRSDLAWLEHKEYSLRWISSKLLSKAQRGIETVPRMHRRDQVRDELSSNNELIISQNTS